RNCRHDEEFAIAGAGDSACEIVRVGAAANDRCVADSTGQFVCLPAGGRCRRQLSISIQRHGSDRSLEILFAEEEFLVAAATSFFSGFCLLERGPWGLSEKI